MGIDIRNGPQLECIHCALCIDACDTMMKRVGRPTGLIAYDTDAALDARIAGKPHKLRFIRTRTMLYAVLMTVIAALIVVGLALRPSFEVNALKDRSPSYVLLSDGGVRNGYALKFVNRENAPREITIRIDGAPGARLDVIGLDDVETTDATATLALSPHGVDRFRVLIILPQDAVTRRPRLALIATDPDTGESHTRRLTFSIPRP
jgi:polyferredoxin